MSNSSTPCLWIAIAVATALGVSTRGAAQLTSPPVIVRGSAPSADVHAMPNSQNSLASLADGSIVALLYRQTSNSAGGHLFLAISTDIGVTWNSFHPLPHNTSHRAHGSNSGVLCGGRECNIVHVAWADRSSGSAYHSAWYQGFDTTAGKWVGTPTLLGAANAANRQDAFPTDITITPLGTLAVAVGVGPNGGLGMRPHECGLRIKKKAGPGFGALLPMHSGGLGWSRAASIVAVDEVIHCAFKNLQGSGGIAYRSYDSVGAAWQQSAHVMVGPNNNGVTSINGINAGNRSVIARDTSGNLYILYVTGSQGGLPTNNKMRMAYAANGTGSTNAAWTDLEVIPHDSTIGANPRGVGRTQSSFPLLQGGDTDYYNYTLAPGYQGSMIVVYSKPKEDFQNKFIQVWQFGFNVPIGGMKEINFWADTEPFVFERLIGMRSSGSVGEGAWLVFGKNDKPTPGQAPNGMVRLWAATYSTGRTISFGTGCRGRLPQVPRMRADFQFAKLGFQYKIECERFPPLTNFLAVLGTKCQTLDLGFLGAPGCELNIDSAVIAPLQADATGKLTLSWNVPNNPALVGAFFYSQSFVKSPGANNAGAVTSNALRTGISM